MNNETVGSRTGNNVGKVIVNVVDKNGQILTPPEEYQGMPGTAFYIDIPDLNGYIVQGLSGDSTTLSYLTNATFKKNIGYPANLGSVVAVTPNGTAAGTFGRGTLNYNLVYAPYVQAQPVNPAPVQQQTQYQAAAAPRKQKHHWFRWTVIILLIVIILSVWGLYNAGKNAQQQVKQNPVVVKNYNTKPSNDNGNNNSNNGNSNNSSNSGNQQAQAAIDNAKQQIEQHIDQSNNNMLQQITTAIQDGFSMIAARIQTFFQGF